jgi:ribonuclease HI
MEYKDAIHELGGFVDQTTNNRMEMFAVIAALDFLNSLKRIEKYKSIFSGNLEIDIFTDSSYTYQGITKWLYMWKKNNWKLKNKKKVLNKGLWEILEKLNTKFNTKWFKVAGHSNNVNNNRVDQLAVYFSKRENPFLHQHFPPLKIQPDLLKIINSAGMNQLENQTPSLFGFQNNTIGAEESQLQKLPYPYYLSFIDHELFRDSSWSECEKRVKGVSGALYKKIKSEEEEKLILEKWLKKA